MTQENNSNNIFNGISEIDPDRLEVYNSSRIQSSIS
jgi:hypothetical protein